MERGGKLGEYPRAFADVEVKFVLAGEVVRVREEPSLRGDPFAGVFGEFGVGIVWVFSGISGVVQSDRGETKRVLVPRKPFHN